MALGVGFSAALKDEPKMNREKSTDPKKSKYSLSVCIESNLS